MSIDKRTEMILKKESLTIFNQFCSKLPSESLGLLMMYLQKFNDDNPDNGTIVFTKKEYEKKLGNEEISIDEIQDGIPDLLGPVRFKGDIQIMFSMFMSINIKKISNEFSIFMTCSDIAKDYIFTDPNVAKYNFIDEIKRRIDELTSEM